MEKRLGDPQVGGRANRQKFRDPFNDSQNQ